ncbi:MAG: YdbL family protein [Desulfobulbaceae bacterium]|nr:YdbL family protein [Desulfobulbaceae bacterium]
MLCKVQYNTPIFLLVLIFALSTFAAAQDMQSIKAQMLQRKPAIDALKSSGAIGEGEDGYLHVRQAAGNAANIVQAENADRRKVNQMIAQREGAPVDKVAMKAAETIINKSGAGLWIRKGDGSWYQK